MSKIKPINGSKLQGWFRKNNATELAEAFEDHVFELYDHKELDSALSRVAMLEEIDKKWRGKTCSVVTLVLRP